MEYCTHLAVSRQVTAVFVIVPLPLVCPVPCNVHYLGTTFRHLTAGCIDLNH